MCKRIEKQQTANWQQVLNFGAETGVAETLTKTIKKSASGFMVLP